MPEKDDLNLLLDAALRSYADPGSDSGLEQHILRRIAEHNAPPTQYLRRLPLLWAAGFSLVAACLLLIFISSPRPKTTPHAANIQASVEHSPQPSIIDAPQRPQLTPPHRKKRAPRSIPQSSSTPRLAVFPAPTPLSAQERALVRLVSSASVEQRNDLMNAQQKGDAPLRIAAISIPSLELPNKGKE